MASAEGYAVKFRGSNWGFTLAIAVIVAVVLWVVVRG
jgi:hypothetical protein